MLAKIEPEAAKRAFVTAAMDAARPHAVLDIGANTGEFREIAARQAEVVAMDIDEHSVAAMFRRARWRASDPAVGREFRKAGAGDRLAQS